MSNITCCVSFTFFFFFEKKKSIHHSWQPIPSLWETTDFEQNSHLNWVNKHIIQRLLSGLCACQMTLSMDPASILLFPFVTISQIWIRSNSLHTSNTCRNLPNKFFLCIKIYIYLSNFETIQSQWFKFIVKDPKYDLACARIKTHEIRTRFQMGRLSKHHSN